MVNPFVVCKNDIVTSPGLLDSIHAECLPTTQPLDHSFHTAMGESSSTQQFVNSMTLSVFLELNQATGCGYNCDQAGGHVASLSMLNRLRLQNACSFSAGWINCNPYLRFLNCRQVLSRKMIRLMTSLAQSRETLIVR